MHRVGYMLSEDFQVMALASQSVFEFANIVAGKVIYTVENYSPAGGAVRSSLGMVLETRRLSARSRADTWMVCGALNPVALPAPAQLIRFLQGASRRARRTAGICTGGFVLAQAGLLNGRRATTHWAFADAMLKVYPHIQVEPDRIFIVDGPIWTSAGMSAGLDMALGMVEKDLGAEIARAVAHQLVMHHRRAGGQSQHSQMLELAPKSDRIQQSLEYARSHLTNPLSVEELAEVAHLSPRQFSRVFTTETGQPPAKAIEQLRLEAARLMVEQTRHPLDVVARETGFRDRRHLREVFMRGFGTPPQAMRREARTLV